MEETQIPAKPTLTEKFIIDGGRITRSLQIGENKFLSEMKITSPCSSEPNIQWAMAKLRGNSPVYMPPKKGVIKVLDLFSGCGGLSLGLKDAASTLGYQTLHQCGIDNDPVALAVYRRNLQAVKTFAGDVSDLVDFDLWEETPGDPVSSTFVDTPEAVGALEHLVGQVDILIGGPPCQGHSNLNNHTRRLDPRNLLYLTMPAIAVALGAKVVIIENVPEVRRDKHKVVETAKALFESYGYTVTDTKPLNAVHYGVAQTRKRHFLIASRGGAAPVDEVSRGLESHALNVNDAIGDLACIEPNESIFDSPAQLSAENQTRIKWLHDNDELDLPNKLRPDCHKDGHTYPSVYGRLDSKKPSLTVTGGFLSPGRGRYIHPTRPRGLTPHEAARLQGFPDDFKFLDQAGNELARTVYSKLIGNAVPPPLAFVPALAALLTLKQ